MVATYVAAVSVMTLLGHSEAKTTYLGMAILIAAAAIMLWLAKEKRKLSAVTGSAALRADAGESALCAYQFSNRVLRFIYPSARLFYYSRQLFP